MKDKAKQQPVEEIEMVRNEMKGAVFDSGERYRLIAEHAADAIWTVDMNMRPTYISSSITRLLGYSVEEAMAKPM